MSNTFTLKGNVKQYPYRTARVINSLFSLNRDEFRNLEDELIEKSNGRRDNHCVYEVTSHPMLGSEKLYFFVSDDHISIGTTFKEGSW